MHLEYQTTHSDARVAIVFGMPILIWPCSPAKPQNAWQYIPLQGAATHHLCLLLLCNATLQAGMPAQLILPVRAAAAAADLTCAPSLETAAKESIFVLLFLPWKESKRALGFCRDAAQSRVAAIGVELEERESSLRQQLQQHQASAAGQISSLTAEVARLTHELDIGLSQASLLMQGISLRFSDE